jgi:hypothetical protein
MLSTFVHESITDNHPVKLPWMIVKNKNRTEILKMLIGNFLTKGVLWTYIMICP